MARNVLHPDNAPEPAPEGHNSSLTDDHEALFLAHLHALRARDAALELAMEGVRAVRKVRTQVRNAAKSDGFPLGLLDEVLAAEAKSRVDIQAHEDMRARMFRWAGLAVARQGDLFDRPRDTVEDGLEAEADGFGAGVRGAVATPPDYIAPILFQAWMKGWGEGQERLAWALSEKGHVVDRRTDIAVHALELEPEPEDEAEVEADAEPDLAEQAARVVQSWADAPVSGEA